VAVRKPGVRYQQQLQKILELIGWKQTKIMHDGGSLRRSDGSSSRWVFDRSRSIFKVGYGWYNQNFQKRNDHLHNTFYEWSI